MTFDLKSQQRLYHKSQKNSIAFTDDELASIGFTPQEIKDYKEASHD